MGNRLVKRARIDPQTASKEPLERLRQNTRTPLSPVSFAAALSAYIGEQRRNNRSRLQRVRNAWALAVESVPGVNAEPAAQADVRAVAKTGAIQVTVDNPALAHELGVVYRSALLERLRELLKGRDSVSGLTVKFRGRAPRGASAAREPGGGAPRGASAAREPGGRRRKNR
jgi:hypothetical protein